MMQIMFTILGTPDITMGDLSRQPDRPTAQGLMMARNSALSRLQKDAQVLVSQMWYRLIHIMASNTVQYMDQEVMLTIAGSNFEQDIRRELGMPPGHNEVMIDPWSLDLNFEVVPLNKMQADGDMQAMWGLIERILSVPELAVSAYQDLDIKGLLTAYVRRSGFTNIHEYTLQMGGLPEMAGQSVPDEQALAQVDAGNYIPMEQAFV